MQAGGRRHDEQREPARGARPDRGNTLVEVVVAITLLAVVVVPVLGGIRMATKASAVSRAASNVETALINAVDRINRADAEGLQLCDYQAYARAAVVTQGWTENEVTTRTEYLDVTTDTWTQSATANPGCKNGIYQPGVVQRVTITVSDPQRHITRSIQVVKSNV
jgi:type II secretory pathway pseudopilin PulG